MSFQLPSLYEIEDAAALVYRHMPATPQYRWPLLDEAVGTELWVKHENHTPVGAFKREAMRGKRIGIVVSGGNVDADVFSKAVTTA